MKHLTPGNVAERLRVGEDKVLNWIRIGRLPAMNVASPGSMLPRYRCTEADVAALESSLRVVVQTPRKQRRRLNVTSYV